MQKYMAWEIEASTHVYRASEADAERADMRRGFEVELASKDARIDQLENALARIASSEAFDISRTIDVDRDGELLARMRYAESFL